MRKTNLRELKQDLTPEILQDTISEFSGIGTDSRVDLRGQLFWALRGERFDAHDFLPQAVEKGATGLVVERLPPNWQIWARNVTVIKVPNTLKALQDFARDVRRRSGSQVIGITGSNGKTSTKEFTTTLLRRHFKTHSNPGSFNNHFGVPMNLLSAPPDAQFIIAELGMNHAGEIEDLCAICEPDIVLCTMVGTAHIEFLGSEDKVARAKEEIYRFSRPEACRIFNLDNRWTQTMWERAEVDYPRARAILTFTNQVERREADVFLRVIDKSLRGLRVSGRIGGIGGETLVPLIGGHQLVNLAAAASLAFGAGLDPRDIWQDLGECRGSWGRMQFLETAREARVLFDGYNANRESMEALFASLEDLPQATSGGAAQVGAVGTSAVAAPATGKVYAVLAEMRELGDSAPAEHERLGALAARSAPLQYVWFFGPHAADFERGFRSVKNKKTLVISDDYKDSLASQIASMLNPGDLVIVKGSRGMKTERFVELCEPLHFTPVAALPPTPDEVKLLLRRS
ncbi:MAG: UDP-N-acetylmuramoylalanyl-D-glutamyl-2, 6-diaminopimelate--D-alanyl-D-alanine ligase [Bdellovibrio sp.]|nr:MAG: UDP-N-acetylmuramoylalanyl-D-glutamyl-2, 6-diaminopimelate--D-alanyl-D-alanine ligase [Bdellovibrio sp.]